MRPMNIMQHLNEGENETKKCVICGKTYKGWGNDAWPVADGYCCDKCNNDKVLPARIAQMYGIKESSVSNDKSAINKRIKEIKKELDYCRRRDEVCATFGSEQQVYELEKELKELENKLNESDEEYRDFTVTIGFLGGYGSGDCDGTKDYDVSAKSRADAVAQVLDNPDAEAPQDLEVSSIEKVDGDWEVVVAFGAGGYNPGYHTYTEDGSFSEEDAKSSALDEAQCDGDLYVEAVDGTPFDYEMGESAKAVNEEGYFKNKDIERKEGTEDKEPPKSTVSYYIVGEKDFQKLLKLNGGAFDSGYLVISTAEANKLANKQGLIVNDSGIFSDK